LLVVKINQLEQMGENQDVGIQRALEQLAQLIVAKQGEN